MQWNHLILQSRKLRSVETDPVQLLTWEWNQDFCDPGCLSCSQVPESFFFFQFLMWNIFKPLLNLLQHCFCFMFWFFRLQVGSYLPVQFSPVQSLSHVWLCDPMNCSKPGLPVHHQLPEFTQTHIHRVGDAIQPSHPLSSPSPPAPNPSQHQSLFQWVNSSHEVAKVLEFQL